MRPLELRLSGFRSYRAERVVPFGDLDLVAIIGDTGAGKSSLLEAMTWALYGASTWSRKSSSDLLAHGAKRMSVALEFEASGQRWRVTRTFARSGGGGAELECLSDGTVQKVDGVRQVDPRVVEVLGLDYDVFCSCVLLPQGKFERLLKATPGEKTDTLKSILRLEHLEHARGVASECAEAVAGRERELLERRARFRPDPAGDVTRAEADLARHRPEHERLCELEAELGVLAARAAEQDRTAAEARRAADDLARRRGTWSEALKRVVAQAAELVPALEHAQARTAAAREAREAVLRHRDEAQAAGLDEATLGHHAAALEGLCGAVGRRDGLLDRRQEQEREQADAERAAEAAATAAGTAAEALAAHEAAIVAAHEREAAANEALEAAGTAAKTLDEASAAEREAAATDAAAAARCAETERARDAAAAALAATETALVEAEASREAAIRAEAAAHVAAGCAPGDACPVCARALPGDFAAGPAPDLDAAQEALDGAKRHREAARTAAANAERDHDRAVDAAERASEVLTAARSALADAEAAVRGLLVVSADTTAAAAIADLLPRLAQDAAAAASALGALAQERAVHVRAHDEARTDKARADAVLGAAQRALADAAEQLEAVLKEVSAALGSLPSYCALPAEPEALDVGHLPAALAEVEGRRSAAVDLAQRVEAAQTEVEAATSAQADAALLVEREVTGPSQQARTALDGLVAELPEDARTDLAAPEHGMTPTVLHKHALAVERAVDARVAGLRAAADAASATAEQALQRASRLVTDAGHEDEAALRARVAEVRALVLAAERERDAAARQVDGATRLDALLHHANTMREGFEALRRALGDGAFIGFVVARRQRALLAHASRVLQDITGRYAFTDDFKILDRESGLPRSPDTLSGGETFLASLSLALGLVEVADRSGGDLRALFLDEGFGTLDAAVLDSALTALQERANAGRLIGLISHVPTVAESVPTVLEVRSGIEGSDVVRLSTEERELRVMDSAQAVAGSA